MAEPVTLVRLADIDERGSRASARTASRPDNRSSGSIAGTTRGPVRRDGAAIAAICLRRGAAAAADDVDEAGFGEFADQPAPYIPGFVVLAGIRWAGGIRIGAHSGIGDAADVGDMRAQILGAERAVEATVIVLRAAPNSRTPPAIARQQAAGFVGDGAGDHHGHVDAACLGNFRDRVERGLGVERIENGLDQQQIGAAVPKPVDLLAIGLAAGRRRSRRGSRVDTSGEIEAVRLVGPSAPREALLPSSALTRSARRARVWRLRGSSRRRYRKVVIGLRDRGRGDVLVATMSAPERR